MSDNRPNNVFDGKFILVMVLAFAAWSGWQSYLAKKYPEAYKKTAQEAQAPEAQKSGDLTQQQSTRHDTELAPIEKESKAEELLTYNDATWSFHVSSKGMAIRDVELKKYKDRSNKPITFSVDPDAHLFSTHVSGRREPLDFRLSLQGENQIVGTAVVDGMKITKVVQVRSENYSLLTKVRAENVPPSFVGLTTSLSESITGEAKGGFFSAQRFDHQEFYVRHDNTNSRMMLAQEAKVENYSGVRVAGLSSQYFTAALVDKSPVIPDFKAVSSVEPKPLGLGVLTHNMLTPDKTFSLDYVAYVGPKSVEILKSSSPDLADVVDLGFFTSFAKGLLWLMKAIHSALGNWGVAIILLTILVRVVVLPFNLIGYKQMKAMSQIQPQIKVIREKYKNDQQKLNQEMMTLMREAKANPLGGCLPMLVQIPVFFALYQVIGQSIELYQAPFVLWIHDLSLKDPFYVLPVLMGVTMYFQQKISPSTLEPAQQKILMFMPILFTVMMANLPSGLTLYIFVSSIFGVVQQLVFMKDNNAIRPVAAKA